ncbi:hypothetical protein ASF78_13345 [Cellulomonas sp. Leaf334]|nr:hypothetical protein ASF78_13345 [Cellulomonas sp. Leaf334]
MRRPRRAVRHAGTVGGDDANLVSSHPALQDRPLTDDSPSADISIAGDAGPDSTAGAAGLDDARGARSAADVPPATGRAGGSGPTAVPPASEDAVATRSADDSDVGWGDRETGSNDDRLHQDKPPHW